MVGVLRRVRLHGGTTLLAHIVAVDPKHQTFNYLIEYSRPHCEHDYGQITRTATAHRDLDLHGIVDSPHGRLPPAIGLARTILLVGVGSRGLGPNGVNRSREPVVRPMRVGRIVVMS